MSQEEQFDEKVSPYPTRLDRRDLLSLMAALLYDGSVKDAVDVAYEIDKTVADKLRQVKYQRKRLQVHQPLTPDEVGKR